VEAGDAEAFAEVEGVSVLALGAGVEREGVATGGAGMVYEPAEHGSAVSEGAGGDVGNEVIDVEGFSAVEHVPGPKAGDGGDSALVLERGEVVALRLLGVDAREEIGFGELGAKLVEDGEAAEDLGVGGGEVDAGHGDEGRTATSLRGGGGR